MALEKVGFIRKAVRKLFGLSPFTIYTPYDNVPILDTLDVIRTFDHDGRFLILWKNKEADSLTVVEIPEFKTIVREQLWMAAMIYLLKYKLI